MSIFPPIEELLAHRGNMLLLQNVIACTDNEVTCCADPDAQAWYADRDTGAMPAWIGIELMAQAIASHVALLARRRGQPPRPGALLGTRSYQAQRPSFPAGEKLLVRAHATLRTDEGLASYDCTVSDQAGVPIATAVLTVYEPADFKQFILGKQVQ